MKKSDFDFDLPRELIAQVPLPERSASRLLLLDVAAGSRQDRMFRELPDLLDVFPEERPALKYHLEAIIIGGIVAAGYLNAAIQLFR